jgi:hypothetical protein
MTYELHPLCTLFPRLSGAEFSALVEDIRSNGLRQPIVLHGGMILDGGNRYLACVEAGVQPLFTQYTGQNLVTYVLSANLHRRHLSAGQQAAIVASAQDWNKAQTVGNPSFKAQKCNVAPLDTSAGRAAESGASLRTQKMADKVAKANPELAKQVGHGTVSLPKALAQVEKKPAKAPAPIVIQPIDDTPSDEELAFLDQQQQGDLEQIQRLLDADDALAVEVEENKRLRLMVARLQQRIDGLLVENGELVREVKSLRRKLDRAEA